MSTVNCMGVEMEMTPERLRRTKQALQETHNAIALAKRNSPQFWNVKLIADCEAHVEKLTAMIAAAEAA